MPTGKQSSKKIVPMIELSEGFESFEMIALNVVGLLILE